MNALHVEVDVIANAMTHAALVTLRLREDGIGVIAAMANGRRPTIMVDALPPGLPRVVKRRHPNGVGGTTVVEASEFHGCQLEWMHDVPNGQAPDLYVVQGAGHG